MEVNRIYNESNMLTMGRMPDGFVDMVLTSPPYDDLRVYNGYDWIFEEVAVELFRVVKDGGVVVWVVNDKTKDGDESGSSFRQALYFKEVGFKLWDTMIWEKENGYPGDFGKRYRPAFEYMFVFVKGKEPKTFNPKTEPTRNPGVAFSKVRLEREGRRYLGGRTGSLVVAERRIAKNVFTYPTGFVLSGGRGQLAAFKHPAVFPESLALDRISEWSNPGDLVYDCFMGSGTTAKAAHQLNRRWIGSEISSEYVELANKRLEPYLAQEALF